MDFVLELLQQNMGWIVSFVASIGVLSTVIKKLTNLIKEVADVGATIEKALEDDKISNEEITLLVKEVKEVGAAAKGFWSAVVGIFKKSK